MTFAPVGIRCPDHSGVAQGRPGHPGDAPRELRGQGRLVTKALIGINVGVYLLELALGGQINGTGNEICREGVLYGPLVANGDYWRLVSAMFLHYGPIHLGLNMLALWWFGAAVEQVLGRGRYLLLYIVAAWPDPPAHSSSRRRASPSAPRARSSAFSARFRARATAHVRPRRWSLSIIVLNLAFTFFIPGSRSEATSAG